MNMTRFNGWARHGGKKGWLKPGNKPGQDMDEALLGERLAVYFGDQLSSEQCAALEDRMLRRLRAGVNEPEMRAAGVHVRKGLSIPLLAVAVVVATAGAVFAATGIANLGKPTNTASPAEGVPLAGFRNTLRLPLRIHGRPEVLFIGAQWDEESAASRWPMVKTLDEFGQWSRLQPSSSNFKPPRGAPPEGPYPTFDWTHAVYRSRYLTFVHRDLSDRDGHTLQVLSSQQRAVFKRMGSRFPLVVIGNYSFTGAIVPYGYMEDPLGKPFSFAAVQTALQREQRGVVSSFVQNVNGASNVIAALICHADGGKPRSVCNRSIIRRILSHVK